MTPLPESSVNPAAHQVLPAIFDLADFGHVCHGAAGVEIGKDRDLAAMAENVGALRHEVHAAKYDVLAAGGCRLLRKFVGVATKIGEANDFIALVVVAENHAFAAQSFAGRGDALVHGVVGQHEIIFQTANSSCGCHNVLAFSSGQQNRRAFARSRRQS